MKLIEEKKVKEYTKIQEKLAKQSSLPRCKAILRGGKNVGKRATVLFPSKGLHFVKFILHNLIY